MSGLFSSLAKSSRTRVNDETFGSFTNTAKVTGFWSNMPFTDSDVADVIFE